MSNPNKSILPDDASTEKLVEGIESAGNVSIKHGESSEADQSVKPPFAANDDTPRRRLKLTAAADCKDVSPPDWVVKNVVAAGNLFPVFGEPKSSKSFITLDLGWHIAVGDPWFGNKVKQGGVLIVCAERQAVMKRRVAALVTDRGKKPHLYLTGGAFSLHDTPEDVEAIIEAGREIERRAGSLRLLVVDTLAKACAGADDVSDMPKILAPFTRLQDAFPDAVICPIHHSPAADSTKMRGRSDLRGAIDGGLQVSKSGDSGGCAKLVDSNDAPKPFEEYYKLRDVPLGIDEDGEPFGSAVVDHASHRPLSGRAKVTLELLEALQVEGENEVALEDCRAEFYETFEESYKGKDANLANARRQAFNRALKSLEELGLIDVSGDSVILKSGDDTSVTEEDNSPKP